MAIPLILKPKKKYELLRLGRNFDGGYLVGTDSLKKSEIFMVNVWVFPPTPFFYYLCWIILL